MAQYFDRRSPPQACPYIGPSLDRDGRSGVGHLWPTVWAARWAPSFRSIALEHLPFFRRHRFDRGDHWRGGDPCPFDITVDENAFFKKRVRGAMAAATAEIELGCIEAASGVESGSLADLCCCQPDQRCRSSSHCLANCGNVNFKESPKELTVA